MGVNGLTFNTICILVSLKSFAYGLNDFKFTYEYSYKTFYPLININFVSYFSLFSGEYSSKMICETISVCLKKEEESNLF